MVSFQWISLQTTLETPKKWRDPNLWKKVFMWVKSDRRSHRALKIKRDNKGREREINSCRNI